MSWLLILEDSLDKLKLNSLERLMENPSVFLQRSLCMNGRQIFKYGMILDFFLHYCQAQLIKEGALNSFVFKCI